MKNKFMIKFISSFVSFVMLGTISVFAVGWVDDGGGNWKYVNKDDQYVTNTIQASGDDKYYIDEDGYMVRDYILEDYNNSVYYFDEEGKMVRNTWVAVDQTQVYNQMDNPPSIYLYYFGSDGKAYKSEDGIIRKTIDGKKYLFNEYGQMLSGWINEQGERFNDIENNENDPFDGFCYYAGDETDGVLREGWTAWEEGSTDDRYYQKQTLWFYFDPHSNKKVQSGDTTVLLKRDINGKTYNFDANGIMTEGWDAEALDPNNQDISVRAKKFFVDEGLDSGRMTKKEWYFAIPSKKQNLDDHEAEIKRWFYFSGAGDVFTSEMRKVNNDYYVFDSTGIMKSGLCIVTKNGKQYVDTIDTESTDGKDFIISRHYVSKDGGTGKSLELFDSSTQLIYYFNEDETDASTFGKRSMLKSKVAFGDDDYDFLAKSNGEYEGVKNNEFYQNGIKLKADKSIGFGLAFVGYSVSDSASSVDHTPSYNVPADDVASGAHSWAREDRNHAGVYSDFIVLNYEEAIAEGKYPVFYVIDKSGKKVNKAKSVKKDKLGNYWAIGTGATLIGIYSVPIRYKNGWQFKSMLADSEKYKVDWINFGTLDGYGKTCRELRSNVTDEYRVDLTDSYAINFRFN